MFVQPLIKKQRHRWPVGLEAVAQSKEPKHQLIVNAAWTPRWRAHKLSKDRRICNFRKVRDERSWICGRPELVSGKSNASAIETFKELKTHVLVRCRK